MKNLILGSLLALVSQSVLAQTDLIFKCATNTGRILQLEHDRSTDTFALAYGENNELPVISVEKQGNNLGTMTMGNHSAETREIYFPFGAKGMVVVGLVDMGSQVDGYINTPDGKLQDACTGKVFGNFKTPQLFENLTRVDDN